MSVFRRRVYEAIGGFDEALRTNEDYDYWLRAALAGFRFWRNDRPLGHYRRRDDSLSASDVNMLAGILRVYRKLRPLLADRPAELRIARRAGRAVRARVARRARAHRVDDRGHGRSRRPPVGALRAAAADRPSPWPASWRGACRGCWRAPISCAAPVTERRRDRVQQPRPDAGAPGRSRRSGASIRRSDDSAGGRRILVEARTPMNLAVLRPVFDRLLLRTRIRVQFTGSDAPTCARRSRSSASPTASSAATTATWTPRSISTSTPTRGRRWRCAASARS